MVSLVRQMDAGCLFVDYDFPETHGLRDALSRYWAACTAEEERRAYAEVLAAGGVPSYGESEAEVDRLLARYGLRCASDVLAVTRAVARGT